MKLTHLGAISTGIVILASIALVVPALTYKSVSTQKVMLSFIINENADDSLPSWCSGLYEFISENDLKATIFVTGKTADEYPQCLSIFSNQTNVDLGSRTYSYVDLKTVNDYSQALLEVKQGKMAVDNAGSVDSKLFKAPYGSTDENIYSLLNRSGVTADFSYQHQYNWHNNEQFIKFDLESYVWDEKPANFPKYRSERNIPIEVILDNSIPISEIERFVLELKSETDVELVNASELVNNDLTDRSRQI